MGYDDDRVDDRTDRRQRSEESLSDGNMNNEKHGLGRRKDYFAHWSHHKMNATMFVSMILVLVVSFETEKVTAFITPSSTCGLLSSRRVQFQGTTGYGRIMDSSGRMKSSGVMMVPPPGAASRNREDEIRRKISQLKKAGKIKKDKETDKSSTLDDDTSDNPLLSKLRSSSSSTSDYDERIKAKLNAANMAKKSAPVSDTDPVIDDINRVLDDDPDERDLDEEELVDLVARKLSEKSEAEAAERNRKMLAEIEEYKIAKEAATSSNVVDVGSTPKKSTTGVGGNWAKNETAEEESYRPSRGSWGYFPRPKDISKAYGGGRRVGVGFSKEDELSRMQSEEETKRRLQQYREKAGIDVQSEKDHAEEIEEALALSGRAMQRGVYSTAVSVLEKVTKYCSTNSRVGGRVFLELAMAYEASGQSDSAVTIYATLSKSRIEEIKISAKKLLYGLEALNFMKNEARDSNFSRKKAANLYMEVTGLDRIADNFDDKYETAYVDLDRGGNYYKRLTESVVRSNREARQILFRAVGSGEVDRFRVVQALRSISRSFDAALAEEISNANQPEEEEPVAIMDGKPIYRSKKTDQMFATASAASMEFTLATSDVMKESLDGEWRLQLMADKKGDAVKYYNTSLAWQTIESSTDTFQFLGPSGFLTTSERGTFELDAQSRALTRMTSDSGGAAGFLSSVLSGGNRSGASKAGLSTQQVMSVDEVLCITRLFEKEKRVLDENVKEYFCVWRRVEPGTYSKAGAR